MTENFDVTIVPPDASQDALIWDKLNLKTKPQGSLGRLEYLAFQIARIQETLSPELRNPVVLVFAGDHGIAQSGLVNPYPQEVTHQMVLNFLAGGAAINAMSKTAGMDVIVVDAGVNHSFDPIPSLIDAKIDFGTADYRSRPAMSLEKCQEAMHKGAEIVADVISSGTNVIGFGEMGIGNTSSASLIMSAICDIPLAECVGKGTGATGDLLDEKLRTLQEAQTFHGLTSATDVDKTLATFGGFEIAQMVGGMLQAASQKCMVLVDGFISTAAYLVANKMKPSVKEYAVFTHQSEELGHTKVLAYLEEEPLLQLQMRLGEGTGCAASYPLLKMAVAILNNMASFESAGVSEKVGL